MKNLTLTLIALFLSFFSYTQEKMNMFGAEIYRLGSINAEKIVNGNMLFSAENEKVSHITTNFIIEESIDDVGMYSEVDLSFITTLLTLKDTQNYNSSLSFLIGAFFNEKPIRLGAINTYIGFGADFDLSFSRIYVDNSNRSIDGGTIGLNSRIDFELNDFLFLHNSITRGGWKSAEAEKWEFKSTIGFKIIKGLGFAYSFNFMSLKNDYDSKSGETINEKSRHTYNNFSILAVF